MASKRDVAWQLKRAELQDLVRRFDVEVRGDARVLDDLVDAVVAKRKLPLREMLAGLSRDRLKDICLALDLDDRGREKSLLIDRIVGAERDNNDLDDADGDEDIPNATEADGALRALLGSSFVYQSSHGGWPILGKLVLGDLQLEVAIYVRIVGGSHRDDMERRIQNPGAGRPITKINGRHSLLLGIWNEQGAERTVIAAFDAMVRVDRDTRYSCFVPLNTLEQAADTGFAIHINTFNERIYAFRPENSGRYLRTLLAKGDLHEDELVAARDTSGISMARTKTTPDIIDPTSTDELYIRPRVGMYAAFARLNYKPWFAIAEFLDNSIQSFLTNRDRLRDGTTDEPLVIDVSIDHSEIRVTDRAGGIALNDFPRAFSPAAPPDDPSGLSEFGLGMKAAACWFARQWSVRTSAIGDPLERTVQFDIPRISKEGIEHIPIETRPARDSDHYTVISMTDLRFRPRGKTLTKIREHLSSIYRVLMADNVVRIRLNTAGTSEELSYTRPELLEAPYFREPSWPAVKWYRDFAVSIDNKRVTGWAGILKKGSHSQAGFSVFRRRRLIEGSIGETYKPAHIFGSPNKFPSQRIIGEMFVEGFDVTHTKDGIQWGDYEDEILESIRAQINSAGRPLIDQAHGYRARTTAAQLPQGFGVDALEGTVLGLQSEKSTEVLQHEPTPIEVPDPPKPIPPETVIQTRELRLQVTRHGKPWTVHLELIRDPASDFYSVESSQHDGTEVLRVRVNLDHEFSIAWLNENEEAMHPMLRFIAALAIGERITRMSGVVGVATLRRTANELLAGIVSDPREVEQ
jgi:hypothetical protein